MYFNRIPWTSRGYECYSRSLESLGELEGPTFAVKEGVLPWTALEHQDDESGGKSFHQHYRAIHKEWMHQKWNIIQAKGDQSDETPKKLTDQLRRATFRFLDVECVAGYRAPLLVKYLTMARKNNQLWTQWWHSADPLSLIYPKIPRKDWLSPDEPGNPDRTTMSRLRKQYYGTGTDSDGKDESDKFTMNEILLGKKRHDCFFHWGSYEQVAEYHDFWLWPSAKYWNKVHSPNDNTDRHQW
jgi:hypothetical protein